MSDIATIDEPSDRDQPPALKALLERVYALECQVESLTGFVGEVCDQTNEQWQRINSISETIEKRYRP